MKATSPLGAGFLVLTVLTSCQAPRPPHARMPESTASAARIELGTLRPDSWRLVAWSAEEEAAPTPSVTLRHASGTFSGRSGCNRYSAPVEQRPGRTIAVGAIAVTRMMCPPPIVAIEQRFLGALGRARALERRDDTLSLLTTDDDGRPVALRFTPETHPAD